MICRCCMIFPRKVGYRYVRPDHGRHSSGGWWQMDRGTDDGKTQGPIFHTRIFPSLKGSLFQATQRKSCSYSLVAQKSSMTYRALLPIRTSGTNHASAESPSDCSPVMLANVLLQVFWYMYRQCDLSGSDCLLSQSICSIVIKLEHMDPDPSCDALKSNVFIKVIYSFIHSFSSS